MADSTGGLPLARNPFRWNVVVPFLLAIAAATLGGDRADAQRADTERDGCVRSPTAHCVIGLSLAEAGAITRVDELADALVRIANAQAEAEHDNAARLSLSRALAAADAIDETVFANEPSLVGSRDAQAGQERATVMADIAGSLAALGEVEQAQMTFDRAIAVAEAINGTGQRTYSLVSIATAQLAAGLLGASRETFARIDVDESIHYLSMFHETVRMQAEAGDTQGALITAQRIPEGTVRHWALAAVAGVQASTGDTRGALATANRIEDAYFRMLAVRYVGTARADAGDIDGAWGAVDLIEDIWDQDRDGEVGPQDVVILQAYIVGHIVDAHIAAGEIEAAIAAADGMEDDFSFVEASVAIAKAQIATGDFEAARTTAAEICSGHNFAERCVETLASLAVMQSSAGRDGVAQEFLSEAEAVAGEILYDHDRTRAFVDVHAARIDLDDVEGARSAFANAVAAAGALDGAPERVETLIEIGGEAGRKGDAPSAVRALAAALMEAEEFELDKGRVFAFSRIGLAWMQLADATSARNVFSRAVATAVAMEEPSRRAVFLADIAFALTSGRLPRTDGS